MNWATRCLLAAVALASVGCRQEAPLGTQPPPSSEVQVKPAPEVAPRLDELEKTLQTLRRAAGKYETPDAALRAPFQEWLLHLVTSAESGLLPSRAAPAGFAGRIQQGGALWLLAEEGPKKVGAGAYVLRPAARNDLVIQAPHTFFDQGTLPIALTLFDALGARVLMINTLHRGGSAKDDEENDDRLARSRSGKEDSDLAHQPDSYYQAAHLAFGAQWPQTRFIQVHGFRDEKLPGVNVVVSAAGTRFDALPVVRALNNTLGAGTARLYPEEVKLLGGTSNVQARACKEANWQFLHLEISASLRQRLERQPSLREQFARALAEALVLR